MSAATTAPTRPPRRPGTPAPDPIALSRLLVQAWFEVQTGCRPFIQLAPLVTPALKRRLFAQLTRSTKPGCLPPARIRRVVASTPSDRAHEVCVLVEQEGRVTAIALRLERHHGAWRAVELTAPEAGLAPLATPAGSEHRPRDAFDEVLEELADDGA